jgi:2'-5' RNA ligase
MAPRLLPPHLSFKSALVLLPSVKIIAPIEPVRRVYDKHFARWPPHMNLLYPFLTSPSDLNESSQLRLKEDVRARIKKVTESVEPFQIFLNADPPGTFSHDRTSGSRTVWLGPSSQDVQQLQAALQAEFCECNYDTRPFTPHLSVGQADSDSTVQRLQEAIRSSISEYTGSDARSPLKLRWYIDRVCLLQRRHYHDRFRVVGKIYLGKFIPCKDQSTF